MPIVDGAVTLAGGAIRCVQREQKALTGQACTIGPRRDCQLCRDGTLRLLVEVSVIISPTVVVVVLLPLGQRRTRTLHYARSPSSCSRKKNSHHPAPDKAVQRAHAHRRRLSATTAGGASTRGARCWRDSLNASCREGPWSLFSCSLTGLTRPAG